MAQSYFTTVHEAIQKGKMNLQTIPYGIMLAGGGASALLFFQKFWFPLSSGQPPVDFNQTIFKFMGLSLLGVVAGFAWRNFHSAAWKIWAFENVQDIHRLQQLAEQKNMINKRGSFFNNFEFATADQRARLAELETRLDEPRKMEAPTNLLAAESREFKYSMKMLAFQVLGIVPFFFIMRSMTGKFEFFPFGLFLIIFVGAMAFRWLPRIGQLAPLRLDADGFYLKKEPLVPWGEVENITLETRRRGKHSFTVLVFSLKNVEKPLEIDLSDIEGDNDGIEAAANEFWARWRARQK